MDYFDRLPLDHVLAIADVLMCQAEGGYELIFICKIMHMELFTMFKRHQDKIDNVFAVRDGEEALPGKDGGSLLEPRQQNKMGG